MYKFLFVFELFVVEYKRKIFKEVCFMENILTEKQQNMYLFGI